jgi:RecB family endonuclease NucS
MRIENYLRDLLIKQIGGKKEVKTPCGYIDILKEDEIIELKEVKDYKNAIGQLQSYNVYVKKPKKTLYLFGFDANVSKKIVKEICKDNNIEVKYLNISVEIKEL